MRTAQRLHNSLWTSSFHKRQFASSGFSSPSAATTEPTASEPSAHRISVAHHEASLGSLISRNQLALHRTLSKSSWHRATRHSSASIHPNLGQLENKRWVLWFVRRVSDDRHLAHRMNFGFLVSQLEGFIKQIESVRETNARLQIGYPQAGNGKVLLSENETNHLGEQSGLGTATIGDTEVQNLFYVELSRQTPLLEEALDGARLPHLVRLVTLFRRLGITNVPTVRRAAQRVHDHTPDITTLSPLGQKLRLAALIENTLAEIEDQTRGTLAKYEALHKRERTAFDEQMVSLHDAMTSFGERWREEVFALSEEERDLQQVKAAGPSSASMDANNKEQDNDVAAMEVRFPTLERVFAAVEEHKRLQNEQQQQQDALRGADGSRQLAH